MLQGRDYPRGEMRLEPAQKPKVLNSSLPTLVWHADWGSHPNKRWLCKAVRHGSEYVMDAPNPVGDHQELLKHIKNEIGGHGAAIIGFDFPIGLPLQYAKLIAIDDFKTFLLGLGHGDFSDFYRIAETPADISKYRPFYPRVPGGTKREHLVSGLGLTSFNALLRQCELAYDGRNAACPLFWTLGGNQVGRAAIIGWRDVLIPALQESWLALWPFDGSVCELLRPGNVIVVETYPAEYYRRFFQNQRMRSKIRLESRKQVTPSLLRWATSMNVRLSHELKHGIENGFPEGDDAFDSVVGLFGILEVLAGRQALGEVRDETIRKLRRLDFWSTLH